VRCHAVLCKSELTAQTIASQLQERLAVALDEFMREKRRSQHSRLAVKLHHQSSLPIDILNHAGGSVRTKFLKLGQNFRPPIGHSNSAPKLGSITEGDEDELGADSAAEDVVSSQWQSGSEHDCDADTDSVFTSSPHIKYVKLLLLLLLLLLLPVLLLHPDSLLFYHIFTVTIHTQRSRAALL